jgi:hypothetical protein
LLALATIALLAPAHAVALDSDLKHFAAMRLEGSNGYSIIALANSERADGRGEVILFVYRRGASVTYVAPATLTEARVDADLGQLGRIALEVRPSGVERTLRHCGEEPEAFTFEPESYRGTFELHGEDGYTEAVTASPREYTRFFFDSVCGRSFSGGEFSGVGLPGARIRVRAGSGHHRLDLQINKNRPGARSLFEAAILERRDRIEISRQVSGWVGSDAFDYDPLLRTATVDPPTPFSGQAIFRRDAAPANRWGGSLTVDFPGRSDLPLTGTGVRATLVHACREETGSGASCKPPRSAQS